MQKLLHDIWLALISIWIQISNFHINMHLPLHTMQDDWLLSAKLAGTLHIAQDIMKLL